MLWDPTRILQQCLFPVSPTPFSFALFPFFHFRLLFPIPDSPPIPPPWRLVFSAFFFPSALLPSFTCSFSDHPLSTLYVFCVFPVLPFLPPAPTPFPDPPFPFFLLCPLVLLHSFPFIPCSSFPVVPVFLLLPLSSFFVVIVAIIIVVVGGAIIVVNTINMLTTSSSSP
jgi:hypothetical protein